MNGRAHPPGAGSAAPSRNPSTGSLRLDDDIAPAVAAERRLRQRAERYLQSKAQQLTWSEGLSQRIVSQQLELEAFIARLKAEAPFEDGDHSENGEGSQEMEEMMHKWNKELEKELTELKPIVDDGATTTNPFTSEITVFETSDHDLDSTPKHHIDHTTALFSAGGTSAAQSSRRAKNAAHRTEDTGFALEISASLLVEIRRLQGLLTERDKHLSDMSDDVLRKEHELQALKTQVSKLEENMQNFKEENWELELRVQETQQKEAASSDEARRLAVEERRLMRELTGTRAENEGLKSNMEYLEKQLEERTQEHEKASAQWRLDQVRLTRERSDLRQVLEDGRREEEERRRRMRIVSGSSLRSSARIAAEEDEDDLEPEPDLFAPNKGRKSLPLGTIPTFDVDAAPESEDDLEEDPALANSFGPPRTPTPRNAKMDAMRSQLSHSHLRQSALTRKAAKKGSADSLAPPSPVHQRDDEAEWEEELDADEFGVTPSARGRSTRGRRGTGARGRGAGLGTGRSRVALQEVILPDSPSPSPPSIETEEPPTQDDPSPSPAPSTVTGSPIMDPYFLTPTPPGSRPGSLALHGSSPLRSVTGGSLGDELGVHWQAPEELEETRALEDRDMQTEPVEPIVTIVEKEVIKEVPVEVIRVVEKIVEKRVEVPVEVIREVIKTVEVPVEVIREVEKIVEVPVEVIKIVEKRVEVPFEVIREVEKRVEVPVEVIKEIEKRVEVPVDRIVEKIIEVPVDRIVEKIIEVPVDRIVEKRVEVPVDRIVDRHVDVPVERIVEKRVEVPVEVIKIVEKRVEVPVEVIKIVEKRVEVPVDRIVEKRVEVPVEVIREVEKRVEIPVEVIREVEKRVEVPVERIVEKIVQVPVDRIVEKIIEVPVERIVEKIIEVPVDRIVEKRVEVPVERIVEKIIEVPVDRIVEKRVEVPVERIVEKRVEIPVEVIREVEKRVEVPVERIVERIVEKIVYRSPPPTPKVGAVQDLDSPTTPRYLPPASRNGTATTDDGYATATEGRPTTSMSTTTDGEYADARSIATATPTQEFYSVSGGGDSRDLLGQAETDDEGGTEYAESIHAAVPRRREGGARRGPINAIYEPAMSQSESEPEPETEPPREMVEVEVQTDAWVPPLPSPILEGLPPTGGRGLFLVGPKSQMTFVPSQSLPTPASASTTSLALSTSRPSGPTPAIAVRNTGERAASKRTPSIDSVLAMEQPPAPRTSNPPSTVLDRTRPPVMSLPPPPPLPPPSNVSLGKSPAPPRPTSPPPPELVARATSPTFNVFGSSSLLAPPRAGIRQSGSVPPQSIRNLPSVNSFRSAKSPSSLVFPSSSLAPVAGSPPDDPRHKMSSQVSLVSSRVSSRRQSVSSVGSERVHFAAEPPRTSQHPPTTPGKRTVSDVSAHQASSTDPAIIQAITQTMIGEFLYKYNPKALRKGYQKERNKKFFWVHPYTKTLYWSDVDPGALGTTETVAKSVYIESVRIEEDHNPKPPGLHQESIVVSTSTKEMKFTAPTKERHEIWINALRYLIARPTEIPVNSPLPGNDTTVTAGPVNSTPVKNNTLTSPRSQRSYRSINTPGVNEHGWNMGPNVTPRAKRSHSQLSTGSASKRPGTPAAEYLRLSESPQKPSMPFTVNPDVYHDNDYDDLENVDETFEMSEDGAAEGFEGLENVRACCDGKHDVGTLSSHPPHMHQYHHNRLFHNNSHPHTSNPPAQPQSQGQLAAPTQDMPDRPVSPSAWSFRSKGSGRSASGGLFSGGSLPRNLFGSKRRMTVGPSGR